jgi:hypothetical protein
MTDFAHPTRFACSFMNVDVCASSSDERWVARLVCMRHEVRRELDHTKRPIGLSVQSTVTR